MYQDWSIHCTQVKPQKLLWKWNDEIGWFPHFGGSTFPISPSSASNAKTWKAFSSRNANQPMLQRKKMFTTACSTAICINPKEEKNQSKEEEKRITTPENYHNMLAINAQNPVDSITCQKKHTCFLPSRPHPTNLESDADRWPNYMEGSFLVCSEFHGFHRFFS